MSGKVGDLSEEQAKKLEEFRKAISDVIRPEYDDYFLLRWLRARKFDVDAAEHMLRKCLKWREEIGADELGEHYHFPEIISNYAPGNLIGYDKEGCPVWLIPYAHIDYKRGLLATEKLKALYIKYFVNGLERNEYALKQQSRKLGREIELHVQIHDLEDLPIWQPYKSVIELVSTCLRILEGYYPERLKMAYVINFPKFAEFLVPLAKRFLSPDTQKKVNFFPQGADWKTELLEHIDPSVLPKHWGGTRVDADGDPKCSKLVHFPKKLPESLYRISPDQYLLSHPDSKVTVVQRSSIYTVEVQVEEAGSVIEWDFMTENRDIGFGIFRKRMPSQAEANVSNDPLNEIPVIPIERVESHIVPEDGMYKCEVPGTYILVFDNSFSWYLKKKLMYNVNVIPTLNTISEVNP